MFIVFEGIDGAGKSTLSLMVAAKLREQGKDIYWTKEPVMEPKDDITGRQAKDWFIIDRRYHTELQIKPMLDNGSTVICDRYFQSTEAYQNIKVPLDSYIQPDLRFLINIDADIAAERIFARDGVSVTDQQLKRLAKIQKRYLAMYFDYVLDGTWPIDMLANICLDAIHKHLLKSNA